MNRQQRRAAARAGRREGAPPSPAQDTAQGLPHKPGLLLRMFAGIVLAPWVLNRVKHEDVERLLAGVARQAGRPEIERNLLNRIAMRRDGKR